MIKTPITYMAHFCCIELSFLLLFKFSPSLCSMFKTFCSFYNMLKLFHYFCSMFKLFHSLYGIPKFSHFRTFKFTAFIHYLHSLFFFNLHPVMVSLLRVENLLKLVNTMNILIISWLLVVDLPTIFYLLKDEANGVVSL